MLVALPPPLSLLDENTILFPSGENIGKESNVLSNVTCSNPEPSRFIKNKLKGKVFVLWLELKMIFSPDG